MPYVYNTAMNVSNYRNTYTWYVILMFFARLFWLTSDAGKSGSGRVRAPLKKEAKQNVSKKLRVANLSSGQTNGLNSSLVFTPVQVGLGYGFVFWYEAGARFFHDGQAFFVCVGFARPFYYPGLLPPQS